MTRAVHWNRRWPGVKAASCGASVAPHGSNVSSISEDVTCKRCRAIIEWESPKVASPATPVERRATVAEDETRLALLERLLRELVEAWDAWDLRADVDGSRIRHLESTFEAARKELEGAK